MNTALIFSLIMVPHKPTETSTWNLVGK